MLFATPSDAQPEQTANFKPALDHKNVYLINLLARPDLLHGLMERSLDFVNEPWP